MKINSNFMLLAIVSVIVVMFGYAAYDITKHTNDTTQQHETTDISGATLNDK